MRRSTTYESDSRSENVPEAFEFAWNTHDMTVFGAMFHEDASFVNRFAHYVRGVDQIIELHKPIHETIYRDSIMKNELIDVIPIADGCAVVYFWSRLEMGTAHPAGPHAIDTIIQSVLTRTEDGWKIKALENVTLTNPRTGELVLRSQA